MDLRPDLSAPVRAALEAVSAGRLVRLTQDLVAVPSVTGSAAESEAQHLLERRLRGAGMDTDLWSIDLPAVLADPAFPGLEAPREDAWGLVGSLGGEAGPTLVLNGHIDVVPAGSAADWQGSPWSGEVRGDRIFGRGACDMKGGLACLVTAVEVLREADFRFRGRVLLQSVVGEEDGGLGTFATLRRGHTGDLAIAAEPTHGTIIPACAGALTFRLVVRGRSAHASVRDQGVDAVEKYVLVHQALRQLERDRNRSPHPLMAGHPIPYPLSVGTLRSGDWPSSVPDVLVAEGRLGVALDEPVEQARAALEQCLSALGGTDPWLAEHPVEVEWFGGQFAPGCVAVDHPLVTALSQAHQELTGFSPAVVGAPWGSDLRLLTAAGIPTVHYGPGDIRLAHAPNESVPIPELVRVTRTLVLVIARLLG